MLAMAMEEQKDEQEEQEVMEEQENQGSVLSEGGAGRVGWAVRLSVGEGRADEKQVWVEW